MRQRDDGHRRGGPVVQREVRSDDPSLTPEANRRLTAELRSAVGADRVRVPAGARRRSEERHAGHSPIVAAVRANGLLVGITCAAAVTVGVAVSLATGSWWAVVVTSAVHAGGTVGVLALALGRAGEPEHLSPSTIARLEQEGVDDPDRRFSELVAEFTPGESRSGLLAGNDDPAASRRSYAVLAAGAVSAAAGLLVIAGLLLGRF